jgi:hypothetical protein
MPAYRVEARGVGCPTCQHGDEFDIIGPSPSYNKANITESAQSQSWGDAEEAEYICELMNDAFTAGRASFAKQILDTANMEDKEDAETQTEAAPAPTPPGPDDIPF